MSISVPDKVKPLLLALVLSFMVMSYLTSDTFLLGFSAAPSIPVEWMFGPLCSKRPLSNQDECLENAKLALLPVNLACMSAMRDDFVCEYPSGKVKKGAKHQGENSSKCATQGEQKTECIRIRLKPQLERRGFSAEEIGRLNFGEDSKHPEENIRKADDDTNGENGGERTDENAGPTEGIVKIDEENLDPEGRDEQDKPRVDVHVDSKDDVEPKDGGDVR